MFGVTYVHHRAKGDLETFKNDVVVVWLVSRIILSSEMPSMRRCHEAWTFRTSVLGFSG